MLGLLGALASGPAQAQTALIDAVKAGSPLIDLRLRYENVDQADKPRNATATTFRARLGYQTGQYFGFAALAEFDFVQHLGPRHYFDSIGGGSPALYPTVADPDLTALNRLQLSYSARISARAAASNTPDLRITLGRQRLSLGNERFIGNAGWRQHEQTYDSVSLVNTSLPATTLTYAYVTRVNRVFGPNSPMGTFDSHSHLIDAVYAGLMPYLRLEGYAYLLDLRQSPTLSTATFGLRGESSIDLGSGLTGLFNAAYARQSDYARNPLSIGLSYYLGEAGIGYRGATVLAGYEVLQGNGSVGFSTPLASLHPFQGRADVFLTTPANGIEDFYVKGSYGFAAMPLLSRITAIVTYHDFSAEHAHGNYGNEWDLQLEAALDRNLTLGSEYSAFQGAAPLSDKNIAWLYVRYAY
jgi:hypothetical protein